MDAPRAHNPSSPAPSSLTDLPMTDSPPKYVPQFSAATEMILKRINSGAGSSSLSSIGITATPPGYEDMRRSVLMGMKTTLNMEIPSTPVNIAGNRRSHGGRGSVGSASSMGASKTASASTPTMQKNGTLASGGKGRLGAKGKGGRAGTKRKRAKDESESSSESAIMSGLGGDSDSDGSSSLPELPKMTQSGRAVVKPTQFVPAVSEGPGRKRGPSKRSQDQALCKRCGRGHSPASNMIVFCDGCNLGWHQMCHDPSISDEAVKDETSTWFCSDCSRKRGIKTAASEQMKGVSWQGRSTEDKRAYLSSLSQHHLVSLLLQATVLHPNLPLFPPTTTSQPMQAYLPPQSQSNSTPASSQRTNIHPQTPFPPSATAGLFSRAESNPNAPINFIRKIPPGQQRVTPPSNAASPSTSTSQQVPTFTHSSSAPPILPPQGGGVVVVMDVGNGSRESTPASPPYPKAGNGLMAKLGPDDEDMEWLVDAGDFEAFSHVVYDDHGGANQIS